MSVSPNLRNLSQCGWSKQNPFEGHFNFRWFKSIRSGLALVSDAALAVDQVEPVRPRRVSLFRGVLEIVDDGGNTQCQLGGASSLHLATFGKGLGTRYRNLIFLIVFILPSVNGMGFYTERHKFLRVPL